MSQESTRTAAAISSDTRLHGAWLTIARLARAGLAFLSIGLFLAAIPPRYAGLSTACATEICQPLQATNEVDFDQLTNELLRVVDETMQPESLSIWLKEE